MLPKHPLMCSTPFFPALANEDPCWKVCVPSSHPGVGRAFHSPGRATPGKGEGPQYPAVLERSRGPWDSGPSAKLCTQAPAQPAQPTGQTPCLVLRTQGPREPRCPGCRSGSSRHCSASPCGPGQSCPSQVLIARPSGVRLGDPQGLAPHTHLPVSPSPSCLCTSLLPRQTGHDLT